MARATQAWDPFDGSASSGNCVSGPRLWVDENDLRLLMSMVRLLGRGEVPTDEMYVARKRLGLLLDPPPPPPLRPYRADMQGHGA